MTGSKKICSWTICASLLLISVVMFSMLAISGSATLDNTDNNPEVKYMDVSVSWKSSGDDYLVNASVIARTKSDKQWTVKSKIYSGDIVNTSEKLKDLIDSEPEPTKNYTTTTRFSGYLYSINATLYSNKTLAKGGYYGAIIYLFSEDDHITYRMLGLWIYVGSIIVTKVYNSTGWLEVNEDIGPNEGTGAVGAAYPAGFKHWNALAWTNDTHDLSNWVVGSNKTEIFGIDDYDFSIYGDNVSIHNISAAWKSFESVGRLTMAWNSTLQNSTNLLWIDGTFAEYTGQVTFDGLSGDLWNATTLRLDIACTSGTSIYIRNLHFQLDTLSWSETSDVVATTVSSSSSSRQLARDTYDLFNEMFPFLFEYWYIALASAGGIIGYIKKLMSDKAQT